MEGGGRGDESYDREKSWPSINHSIIFVRGFRMHGLQPYFFLVNKAGFGCSVYNIRQETKKKNMAGLVPGCSSTCVISQ